VNEYLQPSERLIEALKKFEGFRSEPYRDVAGVLTVGYGETKNVRFDDAPVTETEACLMLRAEVIQIADAIRQMVTVPLTQGMFDGLCSFAYNLGTGALAKSTLLAKLNGGDYVGAAKEFARWVHAAGKPQSGLIKRRAMEAGWFLEHLQHPQLTNV
jgi:lysozyme